MRSKETWNKTVMWKYLDKFPPRIVKDLKELNLPEVQRYDSSVFIYGEVATGKTLLAAQLLLKELEHIYLNRIEGAHNKTLFVSFPELLMEIRQSFSPGAASTEQVMDKYLNAHFLVIDDFVAARPTDWVLETLYHLINHRYEYMFPTVITCNFDLPTIEKVLQEQRITSRINRSYVIIEKKPYKK